MTTNKKLASAALAGLLTAGMLAAAPAFAGNHEKGACNNKNGCKGTAGAEKSECKGQDKASCEGKDGEKASCKSASGCAGKDSK